MITPNEPGNRAERRAAKFKHAAVFSSKRRKGQKAITTPTWRGSDPVHVLPQLGALGGSIGRFEDAEEESSTEEQ